MAIEGELIRAGIAISDDRIVISKDVSFAADVIINGGLRVGADTLISGNVTVTGQIIGTLAVSYTLYSEIADLSAAGGCYMITPTDGAGYISRVRSVLVDVLGTSGAELETIVDAGTPIGAAYNVVIGVGAAGTLDDSGAIPPTEGNNVVAAGSVIHVHPDTLGGSATRCRVQVEIVRTL